jgi:serine protease Do
LGGFLSLAQDDSTEAKTPFREMVKVDDRDVRRDGGLAASYADMLERVNPSVVSVATKRTVERPARGLLDEEMLRRFFGPGLQIPDTPEELPGLGSGVIVSANGYIITNNHVVAAADEVVVRVNGQKTDFPAELIGADPASDVAVIKIEAEGLVPATFADSTKVRVGDIVLAIGSPLGYEQTVTMGIISALGRSTSRDVGNGMATPGILGFGGYEDFIQTDASINPGNSGGALIDVDGRVIGINTAIASGTGGNIGIGFAIPSSMALQVAAGLVDEGEVIRGFLGILPQDLDEALAEYYGLGETTGVVVGEVTEGTPASEAGFQVHDIITEFDGEPVDSARIFRLRVGNTPPDQEVSFKVLRDGKELDLRAKLDKRDEKQLARMGGRSLPGGGIAPGREFLPGVTIGNLDAESRSAAGVPEDVEGVIVTSVEEGSKAAAVGLSEGDVIVEVDRQAVRNVREAMDIRQLSPGRPRVLLRVAGGSRSRLLVVETDGAE